MKILALTTGADNCNVWWDSLKSIGHQVYVEQYDNRPHHLHSDIINLARTYKPDFIVYAGANEVYHGKPCLSFDALCRLNEVAPNVLICGDGADRRNWELIEQWHQRQCFTLMVNVDGSLESPIARYRNGLTTLCPIAIKKFAPKKWRKRTIKCGFIGRLYERPVRKSIIDAAIKQGLTFYVGEVTRSYNSYSQIMHNTRVVFNIANAVDNEDWMQVKARVVEAGAAGCVLLETKNSLTNQYFNPGTDYLEYDLSNLENILVWVLDNIDSVEFEQMATQFHNRVVTEHHPVVIWQRVFDAAGAAFSPAANAA